MTVGRILSRRSPSRPFLFALGLAAAFSFSPSSSLAQSRDRGPILLNLPASTRALSLGNTFALGSSDSDAVFYHPGVLGRVQGLSASVQRYFSSATLAGISAGQSWLSGGVALGVQFLTYGAEGSEPLQGEDLLTLPADVASLREEGGVGAAELVVSAGYGRTLKGLNVGFVGKLVEQRFGSLRSSTAALDLGIAATPGPLTVGLAVQNLGRDMEIGGAEIPLPTRYALGASTDRAQVGPLDLALSSSVVYDPHGDLIPTGGVEVAYWPVTGRTFIARIGFRRLPDEDTRCPVTFGVAFWGDDLVLEYAFEGFESGDPSHRISIGWR